VEGGKNFKNGIEIVKDRRRKKCDNSFDISEYSNSFTEKKIRLKLIGKSIQKVTNGYYRSLQSEKITDEGKNIRSKNSD